MEELAYVVSVNLHRRHLDEFQRAEIALKYDKLYKKIARDRWEATKFTSESGGEAASKRCEENNNGSSDAGDKEDVPDNYSVTSEIRPPSADGSGSHHGSATNQELAEQFGVSSSTLDGVKTILDQGTPEQIQSLRDKSETGEGPGVRTMYEQVQQEKLESKLQTEGAQEVRRDNLKLLNKDFRTITSADIPDRSADLVLVLDFP